MNFFRVGSNTTSTSGIRGRSSRPRTSRTPTGKKGVVILEETAPSPIRTMPTVDSTAGNSEIDSVITILPNTCRPLSPSRTRTRSHRSSCDDDQSQRSNTSLMSYDLGVANSDRDAARARSDTTNDNTNSNEEEEVQEREASPYLLYFTPMVTEASSPPTELPDETSSPPSIPTPKASPRRKVSAWRKNSPKNATNKTKSKSATIQQDKDSTLAIVSVGGSVTSAKTPTRSRSESTREQTLTSTPDTSVDLSDHDDPSLYTEQAGNVTTDDASVLLTAMVCLSTVNTRRDASLHHIASWGKLLMASPERMVRDSLQRHFGFHLSRQKHTFQKTNPTSSNNNDDKSTTSKSGRASPPHPTVQDMATMSKRQAEQWVHQCLEQSSLDGAISVYQVLLERQKDDPLERADTLSKLAVLCLAHGEHAKAQEYCKAAVALHEDQGRPLQVARGALLAGLVHFGMNRIGGALKAWRQAMQLACLSCGYEHGHTAVLLCNMGVLHFEAGDLTSSLRNLEESLELQQTLLRTTPVHVENALFQMATTMGNLAMACERNLEHDRAIGLLDESLQLYGSIEYGDTDEAVAAVTENLQRIGGMISPRRHGSAPVLESSASCDTADSARSISLFGNSDGVPSRRVTARLSMQSSDNHDYLLLGPLAKDLAPEQRVRETVLYWFGRKIKDDIVPFVSYDQVLTDANARPRESMPVDVDGDHVVNAELYLNEINRQAMKHMDRHEMEDALELFDSALKSHRAKYGKVHHLVGTALHNIGMVHLFSKAYSKALKTFEEAVAVRMEALGPDHPDVQNSTMKIGLIHLALNDMSNARTVFWDIRDKFINVLGYGHPQLAKVMNNIGVATYHCGDLTGAYRAFEIAYQYQRRWNEEATRESEVVATATAYTLCNIGNLYTEKGELVEALRMFEEALEYMQKYLPENDSRMQIVRSNIQFLVGPGNVVPAFAAAVGCAMGDEYPLGSFFSFDLFRMGGCS